MRKHYLFTAVLLLALVLASIGGRSAPVAANNSVKVQLAMMLDGSGSIGFGNWGIIKEGLASSIEDPNCVPHDGSVELTVVVFGLSEGAGYAKVEVSPTVIDSDATASTLAATVRAMPYPGWNTPMAHGIKLAADTLVSSPNFDPGVKQALNLVTDGNPNVCHPDWTCLPYKENVVSARNYAISLLGMDTDPQDEFDAEAIGTVPDVGWLRDNVVWPQPGYDSWPPPGPGWVRVVADATEFAATICEKFEIIIEPASKTFNLTITGCEPEDMVYTVSLDAGAYQNMTGTPPSYTFTGLTVGQTYSYSIRADGTEILSDTTGPLVEGTNVNNLSYDWPCASKTFNLAITGCEPEDMVYTVSLAGDTQTMTGSPPSYTFTGLIVGQTYSYSIKADGEEILSDTTEALVEDTNVNNLSYDWPCASKTFNLTITGCEPEDMVYTVSLAGGTYQTMTGSPPSYTFSGLTVGQAYSYSIKADGTEILSDTTGSLVEGTNVNDLSYQWPCASITIIKDADPDDGTDFDFTGDLGDFTLDDAVPDDGDLVSSSKSFTDLVPGTYVITESDVAGWDLTDISCSGDATVKFGDGTNFPHASFVAGDTSVEITLGAGESATCTFTNTFVPPKITVTKVVVGGGPKSAGDFNLHVQDQDFTDDGGGTVLTLTPGDYEVTEDGYGPAYTTTFSGDWSGTAAGGDVLTCTVTNTYWEPEMPLEPVMFIDYDVLTTPPVVEPGGQVQYQIMVANSGNDTAAGVYIWATLPTGFIYASTDAISETGGATRSSINPTPGDGTPTWGYWSIPSEGSVTITFTVDVGIGVGPGTYDSTAYANGNNFDEIDDEGEVGQDANTPPEEDPEMDEDVTIREVLPPPPVGGEAYPVNKLAILLPWIAIAMTIIAGSFIVVRRRRSVRLLRR